MRPDGEQALAEAVVIQARRDMGDKKFRNWLLSPKGITWLHLAGVNDPEQFGQYIVRKS